MARKFIELEEAAKILGMTPDTLNELRERREIYGYRDGGTWKFKSEDLDKLIADRAQANEEGEFAELDEDPDSILLSEVELGQSGESTSSTIIGGRSSKKDSAESDIQLAPMDSDIQLAQPTPTHKLDQPTHDSDVHLDSALADNVQGGSDVLETGSGVSPMFDDLDSLDLDMPSAAESGIHSVGPGGIHSVAPGGSALDLDRDTGGSSISLGSDALKIEGSGLALGGEDDLALGEASGLQMEASKDAGSSIDLAGDEDGDLVLGGSSHGDLSRTGDSGISLLDPADSGLSLESAPLQLGGSAVESLELGEDDMILVDEPAKSGAVSRASAQTEPDSDDDFLLTPLEEGGGEESDSGSQVIALDSEVEFDEAGGASLGSQGGMGGLLEEDLGEGLGAAAALGGATFAAVAGQRAVAGTAGAGAMAVPQSDFSGWNVASLVLCTLLLMFTGMFMYDLMRNMWSWHGTYSVNSSMMDMILSWFQK